MKKKTKSRAEKSRSLPARYEPGWLAGMDTRMAIVRELRARLEALSVDLGGSDSLSYQKRSLAERAIFVEHLLAKQERDLIEGNDFDAGAWVQAVNALSGLYNRLGLERAVKDVPSVQSWIKERQQ